MSQTTGSAADSLSSVPSSPSSLSAASSLDNLSGSFSELPSVVATNSTEGGTVLEKKEGEAFSGMNNVFYCMIKRIHKFQHMQIVSIFLVMSH